MKSIMQRDDIKQCYITGSQTMLDKHHAIHGTSGRTLAEKYGLWVWLRHDVHMRLHDSDKLLDKELEKAAQKAFEKKYSHEDWMRIFGRNYL